MVKKMVEPEVLRSISRAVSTWVSSPEVQVAVPCEIEALPEDAPVVDEGLGFPPVAHQAKKKRGGQAALRTELLRLNPKESRAKLRASLPSGFYICLSGKRSILLRSSQKRLFTLVLFWRRYAEAYGLRRGVYAVFETGSGLVCFVKRNGIVFIDGCR